jgi:large subunit ribosomal protein L10
MRQEKQLLLDEVREQIDRYNAFLIVRYQKLKANAANSFRGEIAKHGGDFEVVRKRLLLKAADAAGVSLDVSSLQGHIGLVFGGEDPMGMTKALFRFSEDNDKAIEVLGGRFDGQLYSGAQVENLSKLPDKDGMRAQLLSVLEAPLAQTLGVMDALLTSVIHCLKNKGESEGTQS